MYSEKKTKDKMITIKNKAKTMTKHCNCKCKLNCTTGNYIKNGIIKRKCECKNYRKCKKIIVGILADVFVRKAKA